MRKKAARFSVTAAKMAAEMEEEGVSPVDEEDKDVCILCREALDAAPSGFLANVEYSALGRMLNGNHLAEARTDWHKVCSSSDRKEEMMREHKDAGTEPAPAFQGYADDSDSTASDEPTGTGGRGFEIIENIDVHMTSGSEEEESEDQDHNSDGEAEDESSTPTSETLGSDTARTQEDETETEGEAGEDGAAQALNEGDQGLLNQWLQMLNPGARTAGEEGGASFPTALRDALEMLMRRNATTTATGASSTQRKRVRIPADEPPVGSMKERWHVKTGLSTSADNGIHVSFCGHAMHLHCWKAYYDQQTSSWNRYQSYRSVSDVPASPFPLRSV